MGVGEGDRAGFKAGTCTPQPGRTTPDYKLQNAVAGCLYTAATLVISKSGYDLANENPAAKYGKVWLLPYNTGKDPNVSYPETYTWYDELIVSRTRIPDP